MRLSYLQVKSQAKKKKLLEAGLSCHSLLGCLGVTVEGFPISGLAPPGYYQ